MAVLLSRKEMWAMGKYKTTSEGKMPCRWIGGMVNYSLFPNIESQQISENMEKGVKNGRQ